MSWSLPKGGSVLITGASAGIGESSARAFAQAGFNLILLARRKDRLEKLASSIAEKNHVSVSTICCDVSDPQSISDAFDANKNVLANVSVLINNAGLGRSWGPFYKGKAEDWQKVIATNLKGSMNIVRRVVNGMLNQGRRGHIVNMGSVSGRWAHPGDAVYIATKFSLRAMSIALKKETAGRGIKVTILSPGATKTDLAVARHGPGPIADNAWQGYDSIRAIDVAEAALWAVAQPAHIQIDEIVLMSTDQSSAFMLYRSKAR